MVELLVLWAVKQLYGLTMVSMGGEATTTRQFSGVSYLFDKRFDLLKGHRA